MNGSRVLRTGAVAQNRRGRGLSGGGTALAVRRRGAGRGPCTLGLAGGALSAEPWPSEPDQRRGASTWLPGMAKPAPSPRRRVPDPPRAQTRRKLNWNEPADHNVASELGAIDVDEQARSDAKTRIQEISKSISQHEAGLHLRHCRRGNLQAHGWLDDVGGMIQAVGIGGRRCLGNFGCVPGFLGFNERGSGAP